LEVRLVVIFGEAHILIIRHRNYGILIALMIFGLAAYRMCSVLTISFVEATDIGIVVATEYVSSKRSKGEVLLFPRGKIPFLKSPKADIEAIPDGRIDADMQVVQKATTEVPPSIQKQTAIFHWTDVNYDIKIKNEPRRLLDEVDGWVKPGTLTVSISRY
jgi:ATP-binding cassette, subfamily G (WHITE), member 2, PDR